MTPGASVRFDLEHVVGSDGASPHDGQEAFHRLMVRGAALKAGSVAVIEQAHKVQAQTRALRAQSGHLVNREHF